MLAEITCRKSQESLQVIHDFRNVKHISARTDRLHTRS